MRPHIVHCWLLYPNLFGSIAASLARVPVIFTSVRSLHLFEYRWYSRWFRWMEWISATLASAVLVNSRAVLEDYAATTPVSSKHLHLIYSGVDSPEEIRYTKQDWNLEGLPTLAIIGRLSEEKDHCTFVNACSLLKQQIGNFRAFVIGDGEMRRILEAMTESLELCDEVRFLGQRKDVNKLLGLMDIVVLTSREEGLPNVLLEAMIAGIPVVSTRARGALDIVQDSVTGFLVEVGNPQAVAGACATLIKNPQLAKEMGDNGRQRAQSEFNIQTMVRKMEQLYREKR